MGKGLQILGDIGGSNVEIDSTLTTQGMAADAKAVGDGLAKKLTIPATAQIGQTIVVKAVDENGKPTAWKTANLSTDEIYIGSGEAPEGAVLCIDPNGEPTNGYATEQYVDDALANLPTGGGSEWRKIADITLEEDVSSIIISTDTEGNPLNITEIYCYFDMKGVCPDIESGTVASEVGLEINDKKIISQSGMNFGITLLKFGVSTNPELQKFVFGYNLLNNRIDISSVSNLQQFLPLSNVNVKTTVDAEVINKLNFYTQINNRMWAVGSNLVIYGR